MAARTTGGIHVQVIVNEKSIDIPNDFKMMDLLNYLDFTKSVAIFVNGKQLLLAEYKSFKLKEDNKIRIIKPLGGG